MNKNNIGSISSSDLIDAKLEEHQMCGSKQCPSCGHKLERKPDWLGLPAGVKFDPTDQELIDHLEAKVESEQSKSHPLIDEFIPTIEGEDGICYTHPEKLPGVTKDGLSRHFFHRPSKAYTTGTRKRRKIQTECDLQGGETRWHKTGKTRPVMVNGKQKGCKKILVLYTNFGKHRKPEKTNWVMHQYHLGQLEEEKEGELVVSKIFYQTQPRQCNWSDRSASGEGSDNRRESGGGSCSSKEVNHREELSAAEISGYTSMDIHQMKSDNFCFSPFRKSFEETRSTGTCHCQNDLKQQLADYNSLYNLAMVRMGDASKPREESGGTCEEHEEQERLQRPQHHIGNDHDQAAFHMSRPSNPISNIMSPLHQTSSIFLDDPYQVSRMILHSEKFQPQHHDHQKQLAARSASGLEEMIIGCTSTDLMKEESSMANSQETEWALKYSYWPEPDNPDHHG